MAEHPTKLCTVGFGFSTFPLARSTPQIAATSDAYSASDLLICQTGTFWAWVLKCSSKEWCVYSTACNIIPCEAASHIHTCRGEIIPSRRFGGDGCSPLNLGCATWPSSIILTISRSKVGISTVQSNEEARLHWTGSGPVWSELIRNTILRY